LAESPPQPGDGQATSVKTKHKDLHGLIGQTIVGRYAVDSVLGVGGMGVVYKAHQASVDREVAIKVLMPEMIADENLIKRFELEARASSRLSHPNTITVYDFGRENDLLYIVMELLQGASLEAEIKSEGAFDWTRALTITAQVCGSLAEAHEKKIVHRDIKPDNIFLQSIEGGRDFVKVLDFGVAKLRDKGIQDVTLTQAGIIFGTPKYMSPEQAKAKELDGRSDVYSLGIVLWEMLMGKVPFTAEDPVSILIQHVHDKPRPFAEVRPDLQLPAELEQVVLKAVAKDRDERFASAAEFRGVLESMLGTTGALSGAAIPFVSGVHSAAPTSASNQPLPTGSQGPPQLQQSAYNTPTGQPYPEHGGGPEQAGHYTSQQAGPGSTPGNPLGVGAPPAAGGAADPSQFNMAASPATRMVPLQHPGKSNGGMLVAIFVLGVLLLGGIGFLIYQSMGETNGGGDAGTDSGVVVPEPEPEPDTTEQEIATQPDAAPDQGQVEGADTGIAVEGTGVGQARGADLSAEQVALAQPVVLVFETDREYRRLSFDFGEAPVTPTDEPTVFTVAPEFAGQLHVTVSARRYRSEGIDIDLTEAAEGRLTQSVSLTRESSGQQQSGSEDDDDGFRDPWENR